jgi:hypothetical protein
MNSADLFRSAEAAAQGSRESLARLIASPEIHLYAALALTLTREVRGFEAEPFGKVRLRSDDLERGSGTASAFDVRVRIDDFERGDANLGQQIFRRWSRVLHEFVCKPSKDDAELRDRVLGAIVGKDGGGVAVVAAVLAGVFGVSPGLSALIAALLIKLIVAPAADEVCEAWNDNLKAPKYNQPEKAT